MILHKFDEDYYINGVSKNISCYENYHYIPSRSLMEAASILSIYGNNCSILDYGCGRGYLVKALRDFGIEAYGFDISKWAIDNCHEDVKKYVSCETYRETDVIICKDVLEHCDEELLNITLKLFSKFNYIFIIVPFGDNDKYRIEDYHKDITHILAKDENWWINKFRKHNLKLCELSYKFDGIKDKWVNVNAKGNGFFKLKGNRCYL